MAVDASAPAPSQTMAAPTEEWPPYADPSYKMPASIEVVVQKRNEDDQTITVAIEKEGTRKPYLGGYRHKKTGRVYHHASSQSVVLGCLPKYPDPDTRRHRDSQTVVAISRSQQSLREYGTQMARLDVLIDETDDRHVKIRRYFTAAQLLELKRQKCAIIQRFYRGYYARKRAWGIRQRLYDAQVARDEADRGGETFRTKNRAKEVERRTNPRTEADFELLYNELEQWRQKELAVIAQQGGTKEQRTDILNQQTRALATIDRLRATAVKAGREKKIKQVMSLMGQPKKWEDKYGGVREVHTQFTVRAQELRDLYGGLSDEIGDVDERLEVLTNVKWTCEEFPCALTRDIVELCDREADLLNRGRSVESMVNLRRRLTSLFRQFVDTPEFNPEADRFLKVPGVRLMNTLPE